jgi:hypothetical protein
MGIDPMNNISNNNKNTLCSYIISTPPASSQRTFNQKRRKFQAHRNFENPKNPNPAPRVNFVGKNSLFSSPYCRACDMPHPKNTC